MEAICRCLEGEGCCSSRSGGRARQEPLASCRAARAEMGDWPARSKCPLEAPAVPSLSHPRRPFEDGRSYAPGVGEAPGVVERKLERAGGEAAVPANEARDLERDDPCASPIPGTCLGWPKSGLKHLSQESQDFLGHMVACDTEGGSSGQGRSREGPVCFRC